MLNNSQASQTEDDLEEDLEEFSQVEAGKVIKLGWLDGVLLKCLVNIWGVTFFLRLSWIVGQAGLIEGLFIIGIANLVLLHTHFTHLFIIIIFYYSNSNNTDKIK